MDKYRNKTYFDMMSLMPSEVSVRRSKSSEDSELEQISRMDADEYKHGQVHDKVSPLPLVPTTLPFVRTSRTVKRGEESLELTETKKRMTGTSSTASFEHLMKSRSELEKKTDLDKRIGLLASHTVTRDGYTSKSTLDLISLGREDLPAPSKLRRKHKEKRKPQQKGADIYGHIAQLKRKQAAFNWPAKPGITHGKEVNMARENPLDNHLKNVDRISSNLQLYNNEFESLVDAQSLYINKDAELESNQDINFIDITGAQSQQVPTNSPTLPNFMKQSTFWNSDTLAENASTSNFYDQASFWKEKLELPAKYTYSPAMDLAEFPNEDITTSCSHNRQVSARDLVLSCGLDSSQATTSATNQPVSSCGPVRQSLEE